MSYEIANHFPKDMNFKEKGPLVSLYQPTHRHMPDNQQDPIVFKNLLRVIENSLMQLPGFDNLDAIMKPFYELREDREFWNHTSDGIAVFSSMSKCVVYNLNNPVKELAVVANRFHIKPIMKAFQSTENYHLLGLSRENFTLYGGNRYRFEELPINPDAPRTLEAVLGSQLTDSHLSHGSYGGTGGSTMYHGHDDVKEEIDKDTEKYFRYVDSYVYDNYSKTTKLPLVLVSLKEYHSDFKRISKNPYLLEDGINKSIESMDLDEISKKVRVMIDAIHMEKIQKLVESYMMAEADSLGSSDVKEVAKAAYEGRVDTILMEEDSVIPGKIDENTGEIKLGEWNDPEYDILDDLAERVMANGGSVFILGKDKMPRSTGIAAIYRYR